MVSLKQVLIQEAVLVLSVLDELDNAGSEGAGEEVDPVRTSLQSVQGARLPFVLHDAFSLGPSAVVHQDDGSLEFAEHGECSVEQLVGDPRPEILNSQSCLVGSELDLHGAAVVHLPVQLFLSLLGVLSVVHLDEGEVFLRVVEHV